MSLLSFCILLDKGRNFARKAFVFIVQLGVLFRGGFQMNHKPYTADVRFPVFIFQNKVTVVLVHEANIGLDLFI